MKDVKEMPNIEHYPQIIEAAKTGRLVIFVGAGVSALIGLPLWSGFAHKRLEFVYKKGFINFRTKNELAKLGDPKKVLSICKSIVDTEFNNKRLTSEELNEYKASGMFEIDDTSKEKYEKIFGNLYSTNAIFVTTNYDTCFDLQVNESLKTKSEISTNSDTSVNSNTIRNEILYVDSDFLTSKLCNGNVIHIHGSVKDESTMLVTLTDYLSTYSIRNGKTNLLNLLDRIFNSDYVVLFMGYGLEELEILEFMLSKNNDPAEVKKHYMLYNAYREDFKITEHLDSYFSQFNTELIPYDITERGYDQLIDIIENWSKYLSKVSNNRDFTRMMRLIDHELNKSKTEPNFPINSVCDLLNQDKSLEVYLFKRLAEEDFPFAWFVELDIRGYFSPSNIPNLVSVEGGYRVPPWFPSNYLINLSNKYSNDRNICDRLIRIIFNTSTYVDGKGFHIENYHVHRTFISMIGSINNNFISKELIQSIQAWKYTRIQHDFVIIQLRESIVSKFLKSNNDTDNEKLGLITTMLLRVFSDSALNRRDNYYLDKVFDDELIRNIAEKCFENVIDEIEEILKAKFNETNHQFNFEYDNTQWLIKIFEKQNNLIINIVDAVDVDAHELGESISKRNNFEYVLNKNSNVEEYAKTAIEKLTIDFKIENLPSDMNEKISKLILGFLSEGTYHSLYESKKYHIHSYEGILDILLRILDNINMDVALTVFERYMIENLFIFQKIVLYNVGKKYHIYKSEFWKLLKSERGRIVFGNSAFGDELRVVLEQIEKLNEEEFCLINTFIENGPQIHFKMDEEDRYVDVWKLKRINALNKIERFNSIRDQITQKYSGDFKPVLAASIGPIIVGSYTARSPITIDEMTGMTISELSTVLRDFKENGWDGPTVEGLGNVLKNFVENNPELIVSHLNCFKKLGYHYVAEILNALNNVWNNKGGFDWSKLQNYIYDYITDEGFWNGTYEVYSSHHKATYKWVLYSISKLIESGCRSDKMSYETNNYYLSKEIVLEILNNLPLEIEAEYKDCYVSYSHRTVRGDFIDTLIVLSLYGKRNNVTDGKWDIDLEKKFKSLLDECALEAYTLMGLYSVNIDYLSNNFLLDQISKLKDFTISWEAYFEGFVSGNLNVKLFQLMKENYIKAFKYSFKKEDISNLIARHLFIALYNSFEGSSDLVYLSLIDNWNIDIISNLQREFLSHIPDEEIIEDTKSVLVSFMKAYGNKIRCLDRLTAAEKSLLSESVRFLEYIEPYENWIYEFYCIAIKYVEVEYNSHDAINAIKKHCVNVTTDDNKMKLVSLFDIMTDNSLPSYPECEIVEIIKCFFEWNIDEINDKTSKICNKYHQGNIYFLKEISDKFMS
ncbi:MAG: SIR2 family protein [Firmicutes bacterium]|nr:SIR2 family protein [Bacillota bacterium]